MSASRNADSINDKQGAIHSSVPRSEPLTTSGHKPGINVGNDAAPTFSAQTLPPGTAPPDRTFAPNPVSETPGQADNDATLRGYGKESTYTSAESTLGGATSADVHTGIGKPLQGQTATDEKRDKYANGSSLEGRGASGVGMDGSVGTETGTG